ncbi:male sterility protein-domain-containing protein [Gongronella butleri]|nr:male sterility protein-domain-containing protein [Gongronella butleri]
MATLPDQASPTARARSPGARNSHFPIPVIEVPIHDGDDLSSDSDDDDEAMHDAAEPHQQDDAPIAPPEPAGQESMAPMAAAEPESVPEFVPEPLVDDASVQEQPTAAPDNAPTTHVEEHVADEAIAIVAEEKKEEFGEKESVSMPLVLEDPVLAKPPAPAPPAIEMYDAEPMSPPVIQIDKAPAPPPPAIQIDTPQPPPATQIKQVDAPRPPPKVASNLELHDGPISTYYKGKTILLTGATGFVGKAILWKLIRSLGPHLGRIYLLIRNGNTKRSKMGRPMDRLKQEILSNKAFVVLRKQMGEALFDEIIDTKIVPIAGDIISPDLSMANDHREAVVSQVQVVLHSAASLDAHERLDLALETNTLGTLRLMDLADECVAMESFVHLSLAYVNPHLQDATVQERVYPMELGDPEELLKEIVGLELQDIAKMTQRILQFYPNVYTFTKSLAEYLVLKRVDYNRIEEIQGGKTQWPVSIVRATHLGAGMCEPLPGWVDGVSGMNSMVFLTGQGVPCFPAEDGHQRADIVPVDYFARAVIGCPILARPPGVKFVLPYNEIVNETLPRRLPDVQYFPYVYQVCASNPATWRDVYGAVQHYWTRNSKANVPAADQYFSSTKSIFKLFSRAQPTAAVANAIANNSLPMDVASNGKTHRQSNSHHHHSSSQAPLRGAADQQRLLHIAAKAVEAMQPFHSRSWQFEHDNVLRLASHLAADASFALDAVSPSDWPSYMTNYCYGTHLYLGQAPLGARSLTLPPNWDCALFSKHPVLRRSVIDQQIESVVFTAADIQKRTERMLAQVIACLEQPATTALLASSMPNNNNASANQGANANATANGHSNSASNSAAARHLLQQRKMEEWIADFDASLDDWCHDDSGVLTNAAATAVLGRWVSHMGDHDEATRVVILNDKRVVASIRQIIDTSGVPQQTVMGEALKILQRTRERTQIAYVWFAGSFLDALFKRLFSSIRLRDDDLFRLNAQIKGKNVVYVPASKTLLDQLLVWYICLRYHLPMPALMCDEALALLGPISDLLRIAGAFFVRRDPTNRSPLNSAVAAAYTESLLNEHGALSLLLERARSRTGRIQSVYEDGILDMVVEAALEHLANTATNADASPASPSPSISSQPSSVGNATKPTTIVPIHITYEKIPDLRVLIDQVLDQKAKDAPTAEVQQPSAAPTTTVGKLSRSASFLRPSAAAVERAANKDPSVDVGRYGRVYVGIGHAVDVAAVTDALAPHDTDLPRKDKSTKIAKEIALQVQKQQHSNAIVSPVSVVSSIILYGRISSGVSFTKLHEHAQWLRQQIIAKGLSIDWQDDEEPDTIVSYSLDLLDAKANVSFEGGKRMSENTLVRVVDHADNVMYLSYMANQTVETFLPEAILSVVYLSYGPSTVLPRDELYAKFTFLVQLFKDEFIYTWDIDQTFESLVAWFSANGLLKEKDGDAATYIKTASKPDEHPDYVHICLLASFLYPSLDAYWITSCSLSALRDLPYMPRKTVPILAQWIAAHLISGRRTIYREVLSTEVTQNAVNNFMAIGFIDAVHPKTKLSPDAQILLLELGIKTNEDLVTVSDRSHSQEHTNGQKTILSGLMDIASLCHEIEKFRYGAGEAQLLGLQNHNSQVFEKCQNQIRSILRADESYAQQHGMQLIRDEDQMIQLVYALKASTSNVAYMEGSGRNPRRVSQAYNLQSSHRTPTM